MTTSVNSREDLGYTMQCNPVNYRVVIYKIIVSVATDIQMYLNSA